jgi:hypothetical protein
MRLSVEDWAEIRRLHRAEGLGIKKIARTLGAHATRRGPRSSRPGRDRYLVIGRAPQDTGSTRPRNVPR